MRISDNQTVILGAPGCGKTTALLSLVDQCFQAGIKPNEIAFVSFSKRAAQEALERACLKFGFKKTQLPFFRTLHSLAFNQLGLRNNEVMGAEDYNKLGALLHAPFTKFSKGSEIEAPVDVYGEKKGDYMLFLDALSRSRVESAYETYGAYHNYKVGKHEFIRFNETYEAFRKHYGLLDFTDMLDMFIKQGSQVPVKVAFIDEAQDLSRLQWLVCQVAFNACQQVVIAGDDDQAIFKWAGADVQSFLELEGTKVSLSKSHRLPEVINSFAKKIITPVKTRFVKDFSPRANGGDVIKIKSIEAVALAHNGSWLWLARNMRVLPEIERFLRAKCVAYKTKAGSSILAEHVQAITTWEKLRAGHSVIAVDVAQCMAFIKGAGRLPKAEAKKETMLTPEYVAEKFKVDLRLIWHDALTNIKIEQREYYLSMMRKGVKLTDEPHHTISTIHGAKGMEADNVVLYSIMGKNTHDAYLKNQDDERRVFYVAVTRAKERLFLIDNQEPRSFKFPYI